MRGSKDKLMRVFTSLKPGPLKLHTKTIIAISGVLVAIFSVISYFSNLATTKLSDQQEEEQAQLIASQVADTVRYHINHVRRLQGQTLAESLQPEWSEVREDILDTMIRSTPQLSLVRIFHQSAPDLWKETVRLPADSGPPTPQDEQAARQQTRSVKVTSILARGQNRVVEALAPVISPLDENGPVQIGTSIVVLSFDENQSVAAKLRHLIWPLMALAIITITLIVYFLFRFLIYRPIDRLLLTMEKAEAGDLTAETQPTASDEIGLLTSRFNRMLVRIREMTDQLDWERRGLQGRVHAATAEIEGRKQQLEEANLRLFELQRQLTQLERLAATGQLAAQFAHEVGTPLNLISGHVQVMRARATDERMIKRLNVIAGQIKRITQIVHSILDSTRSPAPQFAPTDINALLMSIFEVVQPTLTARRVVLQSELTEKLPQISVDSDQLQQVFINLINNSLDAMPAGGTLSISTARDEDSIIITVSDTGIGIAAEQLESIFNPLFTTKRKLGTGLGLTIVKQIVSEHGGEISVKSAPGEGTMFLIKLPLEARGFDAPVSPRLSEENQVAGLEAGNVLKIRK
jgi:two-component system, NtrC family, sensor kinase